MMWSWCDGEVVKWYIYSRELYLPMMNRSMTGFDEDFILSKVKSLYEGADPAHDFSHVMRVYKNAKLIGHKEDANMQILLLSALLHDVCALPKSIEKSAESNAKKLIMLETFLNDMDLPEDVVENVQYAVEVHSFSKGLVPTTLEAKILQDADRLDAMGAIGIARVFLVGGQLERKLYNFEDPFCTLREPDDQTWNLDHFFSKLLKLEFGMHTETGKKLAKRRGAVLRRYLSDLHKEISDENNVEVDTWK